MGRMLHVVMGTTGEWSGRKEWPVAAYFDEEDAKRHVLAASAEMRKLMATLKDDMLYDTDAVCEKIRARPDLPPYDPNFQMTYTGTSYFIVQVELRETFP